MANYLPGRMKRKDMEDIDDDFSDLSFIAPSTKIRRLDADLLPTMEGMDLSTKSVFEQPMPEENMSGTVMNQEFITGEAVLPHLNQERALVVYQPQDCQYTPSFKIDPKLISGLKNYTFWPGNPNIVQVEEEYRDDKESSSDSCLAVVPWVPSTVPATSQGNQVLAHGNELDEEPMEAEGAVATYMEVEEDEGQAGNFGDGPHGFHQWQQYCMIPQPLQSNSTPIMWS